jgi:hypothetical protein
VTRTLYLGADAREVALDGPALRVATLDGPDARIPLRLLASVVARPNAQWSTAALTACLSAGITISFVRHDGGPLGFCLPASRRAADLGRMLDRLERERGGQDIFDNWARSEERRAILRAFRRRGQPPAGAETRPDKLREAVMAASGDRRGAADLLAGLEGILAAQLPAMLSSAGLAARWASPAPPGRMDLFAACLAAARWLLLPGMDAALAHRRRHADAWRLPPCRQRRLVVQYEGLAPAIGPAVREQLRRLEFLLWEHGQ